jgi:pyruvate-formate lyase-activating enzyme
MSIPKTVYKKFKVETIPVERPTKGSITKEPFVRVSVDGKGCPLLGCNCSAPNYISISDGETILMVELTESQAKAVRGGLLCLGDA